MQTLARFWCNLLQMSAYIYSFFLAFQKWRLHQNFNSNSHWIWFQMAARTKSRHKNNNRAIFFHIELPLYITNCISMEHLWLSFDHFSVYTLHNLFFMLHQNMLFCFFNSPFLLLFVFEINERDYKSYLTISPNSPTKLWNKIWTFTNI